MFHKQLARHLHWGIRLDKEGNPIETKSVPICELSTEHLKAILKTQNKINNIYKTVMEQELKQRKMKQDYRLDPSKTYNLEKLTSEERALIFKCNFEEEEDWEGVSLEEFSKVSYDCLFFNDDTLEWDWIQLLNAKELF